MKIFSEKTKKFYEAVDACVEAEAAYDAEQAQLKAEREERAKERKERAKEVEDAYVAAQEAEKHYLALRNKFIEDYGAYHMTVTNRKSASVDELFEDLFRIFF